ncbi:MAG: hypothetical protein LBG95_00755 [Treponema sp.]|jgi:hypothetical protein|nr:hypothetical protein [Treponema sp.]
MIYYCSSKKGADCPKCPDYHRKYPTLKQYKEEYGGEYPKDAAIYFLEHLGDGEYAPDWVVATIDMVEKIGGKSAGKIVCACTPWGKPGKHWRPE